MKVGRGREEERETEKEREKCFHINGFLVELSGFSIDFLSGLRYSSPSGKSTTRKYMESGKYWRTV